MPDYTVPRKDKVALLTVAAQRDCCQPGSPVGRSGAGRVLGALKCLVTGFRARGAPIIHTVRLYRPDGSNVDACRRLAVEEGLRVLMPGSLGAELVDEVRPDPSLRLDCAHLLSGHLQELRQNEWAMYRPRWGAFHKTCLEDQLAALNVDTVVICGCNFGTAVRATIYEATARDLRVVVVPDAVSGASEQDIAELGRIGVYLMDLDSCVAWMTGGPRSTAA